MIGVGLSLPQVAVRRVPASAAGPTTILDLNWLTDAGILNMVGAPIEDGFYVGTWPFATGGTATAANAITAGATDGPTYVTASGVHTDGLNAAVTLPTPVTIPADTDCVIYVKANLGALESSFYAIGSSSDAARSVQVSSGDGETDHQAVINISGSAYVVCPMPGQIATGVYLLRFTRTSGVWSFACTGVAEAAASPTGTVSGALSFDTLFAYGNGTLISFSAATMYLQKLKIWTGTSSPDTAYETANGGTL